jgi:hypothetical protein
MTAGRIGCELALLSVLCVLSIFLFPTAQGPYCAVHGPVSSLQSLRSARRLGSSIVEAARSRSLAPALVAVAPVSAYETEFAVVEASPLSSILRC